MDSQLVYSPSDFVDVYNQSMEYAFPVVVVEGELSSFRIAKGKWVYFDIKDESATLRCFGTVYMLPGPLEDGMLVRIICAPRLHPQFNFSLQVQTIMPIGEGAINKQAELVRRKLELEGVFLPERKRTVEYPPTRAALVTSVESAAYADYTKISRARWPMMQLDTYDTLVQGASAADQIVQAISSANQVGIYDAIVVIRGGGSAEDLSVFNDERVVRAIASSRIPTCVAIGHEVDESLAELAADMRASTPSNLAELMLPDRAGESIRLADDRTRLSTMLKHSVSTAQQILGNDSMRLANGLESIINNEKSMLDFATQKLSLLNPALVLKRGYALVKNTTGQVQKLGQNLRAGDKVAIVFADTTKQATIL
jgi:exodeoxyribonuclease VII large subunit